MEISKGYTWYINDLTDEELKIFIENLNLTKTNCSAWLWNNRFNLCEIRAGKYIQHIPRDSGLWTCLRDSSIEVRNAKDLFEVKSVSIPFKSVVKEMMDRGKIINKLEYGTSNSFGINLQPNLEKLDKIRAIANKRDNQEIPLNELINKVFNKKPKLLKDTDGIFHTQFYYNKSKHGDNFYQIIKKLPVKNQYHDWEDYYLYKQCGTGLEFLKPVEMFNKEFKKVRIDE